MTDVPPRWAAGLAGGRYVDLQVHSTASDGIRSPTEVVEAAAAAGLEAIALTDHDTVAGLEEASVAGERLGVRIVHGIELAVRFRDDELHLLGLHVTNHAPLFAAIERFRVDRLERMTAMIERLAPLGVHVTLEDVELEAAGAPLGRPHLARVLLARGVVQEFREAFDRFLGWRRPAYVARRETTAEEAIALVHAAGGLATWAHPGEMATPQRLAQLAERGLDAVEVLHPSHPQWLAERLFDRAETAGLLPSGGSDWHGHAEGVRALGGQFVPAAWLVRQDDVLAARP